MKPVFSAVERRADLATKSPTGGCLDSLEWGNARNHCCLNARFWVEYSMAPLLVTSSVEEEGWSL